MQSNHLWGSALPLNAAGSGRGLEQWFWAWIGCREWFWAWIGRSSCGLGLGAVVVGGDWSSGSGPGLGAVSGCEPGLGTVVVDRDWVPRVVVGLDWAQWHVPAHRGCSYSIKSEFYLHRSHRIHSPESSVRTVSWR